MDRYGIRDSREGQGITSGTNGSGTWNVGRREKYRGNNV
jgi:hypothetical protein